MSDTAQTTQATAIATEGGHWYSRDGLPAYQQPNKSKPGEFRNTTLRDAKKLGLLPSVTTITKILHSEGLMRWRINEAAIALMTSPRREGEELDAFIERVLWVDREHEATAKVARDIGTDVHTAVELAVQQKPYDFTLRDFVEPTIGEVAKLGVPLATEKVVVGNGYAGKLDLIVQSHKDGVVLVDFKTTKKLPKESYPEHLLQLAAYAAAAEASGFPVIGTHNIYISTTEPGEVFVAPMQTDWQITYNRGFLPLVQHWQWANDYQP